MLILEKMRLGTAIFMVLGRPRCLRKLANDTRFCPKAMLVSVDNTFTLLQDVENNIVILWKKFTEQNVPGAKLL